MPLPKPVSIRSRLLLLVLCIVLPAVAVALWTIGRTYQAEQAALERNLRDTTRALAMVVDRELTKRAAIARVLAQSRLLDAGEQTSAAQLQDFEQQAREAMRGLDGWVELRSPGKQLLTTQAPGPSVPAPLAAATALVQRPTVGPLEPAPGAAPAAAPGAASGGAPGAASAGTSGAASAAAQHPGGQLRATLVEPVQRAGSTVLNLAVTILPGELQRIVDGLRLPADWSAAVLDHHQTVVARQAGGHAVVGQPATPELAHRMASEPEALFGFTDSDGVQMLGYFSNSGQGWTFITALPRQTLLPGVPDVVLQMLLAGAATLALAMLGALWMARRIVGPVVSLKGAAARLQAGAVVDLGPTGLTECDDVSQALAEASASLRSARQTLEQQVAEAIARTREAEQRVSQGQRVEALGRLTGGVAHDFNNLLGVISNSAHLIQRQQTAPDAQAPLAAILRAVDAGSRLTQHLLRFARRQPVRPQAVSLQATLPDAQELLQTVLGKQVQLAISVAPGVHAVTVDLGELELSLINLALNARDALPSGGHVWLQAQNAATGDSAGLAPGAYVLITFTDDGVGIDDSLVERVFEPFFTTKEVGKGTGLGLSQVHGFCAQAGGTARLSSTPGLGTTVSLLLPASAGAAADVAQPGGAAGARPQRSGVAGARVLLVEDNEELADVTSALLDSFGAEVVHMRNGEDALAAALRTRPGHGTGTGGAAEPAFDVVLSDIVMPGPVDGLQLARALRDAMPELPLVLISGYSRALASASDFVVLQKPSTPERVVAALQHAMAAGRAG